MALSLSPSYNVLLVLDWWVLNGLIQLTYLLAAILGDFPAEGNNLVAMTSPLALCYGLGREEPRERSLEYVCDGEMDDG